MVVGRDTRPSGELLEAAVSAGLASAGADVIQLGVVPTPAVAHAVAASGADLGIVLSASHNAMPDNGIKIFGGGGFKLADEVEDRIEAFVVAPPQHRPTGADVGRLRSDDPGPAGMVEGYVRHLLSVVKTPLGPLKVVVDCAEGAASAARAPRAARGRVPRSSRSAPTATGCASTTAAARRPRPPLCRRPSSPPGADVGIAHDGDADRCLAVDADGKLVDGDQILAIARPRAARARRAGRGHRRRRR